MAQVGQWADHRELASLLEGVDVDPNGGGMGTDAAKRDERVIRESVAALRDLGDRLNMLTADNAKLERACKAIGRAAFEECARLAEEEAAVDSYDSRRDGLRSLAAKFRQLAEKGDNHG